MSTRTRSLGALRPFFILSGALVLLTLSSACGSSPAPSEPAVSPDTWATVDGRRITQEDIERAYRRASNPDQPLAGDEALAAKLRLLDDLIVQDLLIAKAAALKIEVPESELNAAYDEARGGLSEEAFQKELTRRNLTADYVRESVRREMLARKVLEQEVSSKVTVGDDEVTQFFEANRERFNLPEEAYHLAQIVITPVQEQQVPNQTGDDATSPQAAATKARRLMDKLKGGASFSELAIAYSEDPASAARGGDMGLIPVSRIRQAAPALRNAVLNKEPGTVTLANAGNGAYTILLVVAREAAGQRDLSTPGVRDQITATLRARKESLLQAAYLTALRTDANVVNYFARRLVEGKGTLAAS
ncbi:MAG TPA: SurA N-terminal domain-containing protein [Vicinamibacterales bacterium]